MSHSNHSSHYLFPFFTSSFLSNIWLHCFFEVDLHFSAPAQGFVHMQFPAVFHRPVFQIPVRTKLNIAVYTTYENISIWEYIRKRIISAAWLQGDLCGWRTFVWNCNRRRKNLSILSHLFCLLVCVFLLCPDKIAVLHLLLWHQLLLVWGIIFNIVLWYCGQAVRSLYVNSTAVNSVL